MRMVNVRMLSILYGAQQTLYFIFYAQSEHFQAIFFNGKTEMKLNDDEGSVKEKTEKNP